MHPYFGEYLANLALLNAELKAQMSGVATEGLDWAPHPQANSLAVLAAHVAGSLTYWIGDVISGRESRRDREGEFQTQQLDALTLGARLDAALDDAAAVLEPLGLEALAETRLSPRNGHAYSVHWILMHALEHTAQHAGHAQLTRQLWDGQALT